MPRSDARGFLFLTQEEGRGPNQSSRVFLQSCLVHTDRDWVSSDGTSWVGSCISGRYALVPIVLVVSSVARVGNIITTVYIKSFRYKMVKGGRLSLLVKLINDYLQGT